MKAKKYKSDTHKNVVNGEAKIECNSWSQTLSRNMQVMMVHIIVTIKWMTTFTNYVNNFIEGGENQDSSSCGKSFI